MGEAVLDKADRAGADSSARRPQQGHQHLDRRPLARPVPVRQPGQGTSSDAATRVPTARRVTTRAVPGLFQRASVVTGFGWLTTISAQALTCASAAPARKPST